MADLQKIVYLTDAQYSTLVTNGTITVGDVTINYSANDLYLTPSQAGGTVPNGGTTGQGLIKASNADGDTVWGNVDTWRTLYDSGDLSTDLSFTDVTPSGATNEAFYTVDISSLITSQSVLDNIDDTTNEIRATLIYKSGTSQYNKRMLFLTEFQKLTVSKRIKLGNTFINITSTTPPELRTQMYSMFLQPGSRCDIRVHYDYTTTSDNKPLDISRLIIEYR